MTVIEDEEQTTDKYGNCGILFKGAKSVREIYDWLFDHYCGYRFCIVLDVSHDEWEDYGTTVRVDFLDCVAADEIQAEHYYICKRNEDGSFTEVKG